MKSIALVSGGLDSLVSLAIAVKKTKVSLCLTFDYGQKAAKQEISSAKKIAAYYRIPHKTVDLKWLSLITRTALVNGSKGIPCFSIKDLGDGPKTKKSALAVWVPNRNAVFINIAAAFAEAFGAKAVIAGFNSEEAKTFPDNSKHFVTLINKSLGSSTFQKPRVISYVQDMEKRRIVKAGIKYAAPFKLMYSCYSSGRDGRMCGRCESCARSKKAFMDAGEYGIIGDKFRR